MRQKGLLLLLCLCLVESYGQPEKKTLKPTLLFSFRDNLIYTEEFIYLYRKNHPKKEEFTQQKINEYLDLLIAFKLKIAEAKERGLDTTSAFHKEFKSYREELKKPYLARTDELDRLTAEAYRRMTEEIRVSHILIVIKPEAGPADTVAALNKIKALHERLLKGEDFEKLARENSEDPGGKSNGGDLGFFTVLQMVYPFEQAAYNLKIGKVSLPVHTRFGYHLVKVIDRRPARGEVEVSHIVLRAGTGDEKKVKNKIFEIYDQLQGGRNWEELCKEYSDDQATKNAGGRLRPFGVGALAGVPQFESAAFSLQETGEISDPFQSAYGWHLVRLERKIPTPPFAEVEASLKRRISRDERMQYADRKALEAKKSKLGFSEEHETKKLLMAAADSNLLKGKWRYYGDVLIRNKPLFFIQGEPVLASRFISFVEKEQRPASKSSTEYITQLYEQFVKDKLDEAEEDKLIKTNPEYRNMVHEYEEGILLFTVMEQEVWNKAPEDTVGLRKFYEANKERYRAGERVEASIFVTDDKAFLEKIQNKVAAGDSIKKEEMKKFKSVQRARKYMRGESKAVDKVSWTIGIHTTEIDGNHYLIQIDNLVPPGIRTLEEGRAQIISDYQDYLEKTWVAKLKAKYVIKVNMKGKKSVISELTKA